MQLRYNNNGLVKCKKKKKKCLQNTILNHSPGSFVSVEYSDLPRWVQPCIGPTKPCERGKAYRKSSSKISLLL